MATIQVKSISFEKISQKFILSSIYIRSSILLFIIDFYHSETLELSCNIEPNRTESNWIEPNRTEFFQYFYVFSSSVWSNRTHKNHPNASNTSCEIIQMQHSSVRSNRTRKNIEILKKFGSREAMFNSVREARKVLEFHCIWIKGLKYSSWKNFAFFKLLFNAIFWIWSFNFLRQKSFGNIIINSILSESWNYSLISFSVQKGSILVNAWTFDIFFIWCGNWASRSVFFRLELNYLSYLRNH